MWRTERPVFGKKNVGVFLFVTHDISPAPVRRKMKNVLAKFRRICIIIFVFARAQKSICGCGGIGRRARFRSV